MSMTKKALLASGAILAVVLPALGGMAISAQDRFTLKAPNGIAFSEFKGYEDWPDVALSHDEHDLKVIAANETMINAYRGASPAMASLSPTVPRL